MKNIVRDKGLIVLLCSALVGILVAGVYFVFEYAVHHSIDYIWVTQINTNTNRLLVIPLCIGLSVIFFGLQHYLDPKSEHHEEHGLGGGSIDASIKNLFIVLGLGYLSLVAGASLGPEAVLVPASMIVGLLIGNKLFKNNVRAVKALAAAAIMALMAAFFHSFTIGLLSIFLVKKQAKAQITPFLIAVAVVASASSVLTLKLISPENQYFDFPAFSLRVAIIDLLIGVVLVAVGFCATFALKYIHQAFLWLRSRSKVNNWLVLALITSGVLSVIYLLGGPLVQFTGNESIAPMLSQASALGIFGLIWVIVIKLVAIGWSKAMGYRGGLVFPMIFVASTLVAITQLIVQDSNFGVGLVATMAGILAAERKAKILF